MATNRALTGHLFIKTNQYYRVAGRTPPTRLIQGWFPREDLFLEGRRALSIRQIGELCGYRSNGGNLSRQIRGKWARQLNTPAHWVEARSPRGGAAQLWVTAEGFPKLVALIRLDLSKRGSLYWKERLTELEAWAELEMRVPIRYVHPAPAPVQGAHGYETLGPGLELRYDEAGIRTFVFTDHDDHVNHMSVSELDPGWVDKLRVLLDMTSPPR
jgi:hypothetical protein